jgi:hypothetical protein
MLGLEIIQGLQNVKTTANAYYRYFHFPFQMEIAQRIMHSGEAFYLIFLSHM